MNSQCILVVEPEPAEALIMSAWLEQEGYNDVMFCPGPGQPDYTCLAEQGVDCPLSRPADVVVVDLRQRSDDAITGTPGWQLMLYYFEQGKNIVAISGHGDPVSPQPDEHIRIVERPISRNGFLDAVGHFTKIGAGA